MEPLPTIDEQVEQAELSSEGIDASGEALLDLLVLFVAAELTQEEFEAAVREEIRGEHIRQYALGRGNVGQMTTEDWVAVEELSESQYDYFLGSLASFVAGSITALAFGARMKMYASSANLACIDRASAWNPYFLTEL